MRPSVINRSLLLCCLALSVPSFAWGPVAEGGANITLPQNLNGVTFTPLVGPVLRAGMEIGELINNALVFEFTQSSGTGSSMGQTLQIGVQTFAGRYTFSVDFLKKEGFTPSLGAGIAVGVVNLRVADQGTQRLYLAFHVVAGARYTFTNGLGVRLDLALSTYGGFVGLQPTAGVSWRF